MAYHGKSGSAKFSSDLVNLKGWSLTTTAGTDPSTGFGDTWESHNAGLTDFSASADGMSKKGLDTVALLGTGAALELSLAGAGGAEFTGTAILSSITETVGIGGNGTISWGFEGNDSAGLVYAAAGGNAAASIADTLHGKHCQALIVATDFTDLREWSVTLNCSTTESTVIHATQSGVLRIAGYKSGSATVACLAAGDTQLTQGTSYVVHFHRTQTAADGIYSGTGICTGWTLGVNTDGEEIITYSLTFTGAVTIAVT